MNTTPEQFRKAVYLALALSVPGLMVVCLPLIGAKYTLEFAASWAVQITLAYVAMILLIEVAGIPLRLQLSRYWAGALFALILFLVGALVGSASSMLVYRELDVQAYLVRPLFWLSLYGFLPAMAFGLMGSGILRRIGRRSDRNDCGNTTP